MDVTIIIILLYLQLRREFIRRVDSSVQMNIDTIVDWATKFEKVLRIQNKGKGDVHLDEVESDGKPNIVVCVLMGFFIA